MSGPDLAQRLQELAELRASGVVDDEEYALAKAILIGEPPAGAWPQGPVPPPGPPAAQVRPPDVAFSPPIPAPATLRDQMSRPVRVGGFGMPLGLPVLIAALVVLVALAALLGAAVR